MTIGLPTVRIDSSDNKKIDGSYCAIPNSRFTIFANFTLSIGLSKKSTTLKCIASITSGASASPDMMMIGSAARVDSRTWRINSRPLLGAMRRSVISKPMELLDFNKSHAASPLSAVMQRIPSRPRILSDAEREALSAVMLEPDLPPQRVLIVDDDKDARELLAEILGLDGIRCMTAESGEAAWALLQSSGSIGLLITDLCMARRKAADGERRSGCRGLGGCAQGLGPRARRAATLAAASLTLPER